MSAPPISVTKVPASKKGLRLDWKLKAVLFLVASGVLVIALIAASVIGSVAVVALIGSLWLWVVFFAVLVALYGGVRLYLFVRRHSKG